MALRWHRRAPRSAVRAWASGEPPPLVLRPVGRADRPALTPSSIDGGFDADDLALAEEALRHREGGSAPVHPRLVELVYRAVRHFDAPWVHVVSGYRPDSATSRHTQGRAVDMVLPGVSDRRLARFLQRQGFVSVGIYTRSGFVHLDVRARSYFWVDRSWPGEPQRTRSILREAAQRHDRQARRRGEEPVPDLEVAAGDAGGDASERAPALDDSVEEDG